MGCHAAMRSIGAPFIPRNNPMSLCTARIPRVNCPEHGVLQVTVPWAEERSSFTLLMERLCISVLQQAQNITAACEILKISWDECRGTMKRFHPSTKTPDIRKHLILVLPSQLFLLLRSAGPYKDNGLFEMPSFEAHCHNHSLGTVNWRL
ncbi:helix-turn-helix domain-containing protein [Oligoflexus sp.]|uniref:helix-turn-helix domain-containing protein n=1 Tax=Oligoflexus sp. TaxID=1971216 RepID=UPI0039C928AF